MKVGSSTSLDALRWDVAVAKLTQNAVKQQGQAAVELIEAAVAPQPANNGSVGGRLHVVA
jgi:hypothetical protein